MLGGKLFAFYQYCRYTTWYMTMNYDNCFDWYLRAHQEPLKKKRWREASVFVDHDHLSVMPSILVVLMVKSLSESTAQNMKPTVDRSGIAFFYSEPKFELNSVLRLNDFLSVSFHDIIYWDITWLFIDKDPTLNMRNLSKKSYQTDMITSGD